MTAEEARAICVEAEQLARAIAAIASERDALRAEVERLRARKAETCGCVNYAEPVANYTQDDCPKCGGSGAVIVEGEK